MFRLGFPLWIENRLLLTLHIQIIHIIYRNFTRVPRARGTRESFSEIHLYHLYLHWLLATVGWVAVLWSYAFLLLLFSDFFGAKIIHPAIGKRTQTYSNVLKRT